MKRVDIVILAALVVAAAGSALGVVTYEDDRIGAFRVTWTTTPVRSDLPPHAHTGAGETERTFMIEARNASALTVTVTIGGAAVRVGPTAVLVELVGPAGLNASAESTLPAGATAQIDVPLTLPLAPVPDVQELPAPTPDAARAALERTFASTVGMGNWTLRVSFAPTGPGPLGNEEHVVATRVEFVTFAATIAPDTPAVPR